MSGPFGVDSLHINVGQGDGAIHLLVDSSAFDKTVLAAVLIDGGIGKYKTALRKVMNLIQQDYKVPGGTLRFDSIIVTHWDRDHYQGILGLIEDDLTTQSAIGVDVLRVSFMKYTADDRTRPETYFYAPNWDADQVPKAFKRTTNQNFLLIGKATVGLCNLRSSNFLGVNFFTNKLLANGRNASDIGSLSILINANPPGANMPGMYCIASDKVVLGTRDDNLKIIDHDNSPKNQPSICAMVIWGNGRISHYFAGDANFDIEREVSNWMRGSKAVWGSVVSMKLSHHGAATSTPHDLLENFNPANIIISAGKNQGFGHPRWEILLYLSVWLQSKGTQRLGSKPLFCTQYPFYCPVQNQAYPCSISTLVFDRPNDRENAQYINLLKGLNTQINGITGIPVMDIYEQYKTWWDLEKVKPPGSRRRNHEWFIDQISQSWTTLSNTPSTCHPALSAAFAGASNVPATGANAINYIKVASVRSADSDGFVTVRYEGNPYDTTFFTFPTTTAVSSTNAKSGKRPYTKAFSDILRKNKDLVPRKQLRGLQINTDGFNTGIPLVPSSSHAMDDIGFTREVDLLLGTEGVSRGGEDDASEEDGFFIYCNDMAQTGENFHTLSVGDMNDFITALHRGVIGLKDKPPTPPVEIFISEFLDTDEWLSWLMDCVAATSFSATLDKDRNIMGFELSVSSPKPLKFNSNFNEHAFGEWAATGTDGVPKTGVLGNVDILVLGLDPKTEFTMTLSEVVVYLGMTEFTNEVFMGIMGHMNLVIENKKSLGSRNSLWFNPGKSYETVVRLQLSVSDLGMIDDYLHFFDPHHDITVNSANVIARKTTSWTKAPDGVGMHHDSEIILTKDITITTKKKRINFIAALSFQQKIVNICLTTETTGVLGDMLDWLLTPLGVKETNFVNWLQNDPSQPPQLRRITLTIDQVGEVRSISNLSIDMEIQVNFGQGTEASTPVVFLVTYSWARGQGLGALKASLWCAPPDNTLTYRYIMPDWEKHLEFKPITIPKPSETLDLATMIPGGIDNIPSWLPRKICQASLEINQTSIAFSGNITCIQPRPGKIPSLYLGQVELDAKYIKGVSFDLSFAVQVNLDPPEGSDIPSALLLGTLEYNTGVWHFNGTLEHLYASTLYSFFDNDSRDGVTSFLEKLQIRYLSLDYTYDSAGEGTKFEFKGTILLGGLELMLNFDHCAEGWTFRAGLGADSTIASTLGDIVASITGSSDDLPDFVKNIKVGGPESGEGPIDIECLKVEDGLFFLASVNVDPLKFTFAQYRLQGWEKEVPSKRVIKVSVKKLPAVEIPVVGNLTQPFDEMFYMWVQDKSGKNPKSGSAGLTRAEVTSINAQMETNEGGADHLLFKEKSKTQSPGDVVIEAGSHFVLVLKNEKGERNVIIDYVFGKQSSIADTKGKQSADSTRASIEDTAKKSNDSSSTTTFDSAMAPFKKSVGPLTISNIGFQFEEGQLHILLDAAFVLGPIGFTLLGFSIAVDLNGHFTLQNLPGPSDIKFALSGLAISFDRPPINISGLFRYSKTEEMVYYAGGIIVAFDPYLFEAAGFYGIVTPKDPNMKEFKSVFVFAKLNGPLVSLAYAEISGITGGFGYNSDVRFPSVSEVTEFPFLAMKEAPGSAMETLRALTTPAAGGWFNPKDGSFWVAAGLKVTAFQTLAIDAVIVVEWNPYVNLGIFGIATADIPGGVNKGPRFAHVELGIAATVDFRVGVMKLEAQLSPNSFILDPSCHLTGGFALYYWFSAPDSDPQLEGNWVFTIGGFHRAFKRPSHYPNPPRLAISWSLDSCLSIVGEAYFAITPKVCMGGGRLHAALSVGKLEAFFDAFADFLINYKPFHFMADGGVSIGVRFTLDLWITTLHISVEISAQLYLVGPPISGTVHVDFWVFGFNIDFGPGAEGIAKVTLPEFYQLVLQSGTPGALPDVSSARGEIESVPHQDHIFSCQSGLVSGKDSQETLAGALWNVRAGSLIFGISCRFAVKTATLCDNANTNHDKYIPTSPDNKYDPINSKTDIYAKPMRLTQPLESTLAITITFPKGNSTEPRWKMEGMQKSVPNALWGEYKPNEDPSNSSDKNNIGTLLDGGDVATSHLMGVIITAPDPVHSEENIKKLKVLEANSLDIFDKGEEKTFPENENSKTTWLPEERGDNQWKAVSDRWKKPVEAQKETIDLWTDAFYWKAEISGAAPPILLKYFNELYLTAPFLSAIDATV